MAGIYSSCAEALQALANGPGAFACHDFDTVREVVLCDAWHRLETPGAVTPANFGDAVREAWQQMRETCAPVGGISHETHTPVEMAEQRAAPAVQSTYDILDHAGQPVGKVAMQSDGAITVCVHGDCHTDFIQPNPAHQSAVLAAMRDIYPTLGYHLIEERPRTVEVTG